MGYLVDSDILIDHLRIAPPLIEKFLLDVEASRIKAAISIITYAEVLSGKDDNIWLVKKFLQIFNVIGVDIKVAETAALLRRSKRILLPDAIIAATAIEKNLILFTRNTKDFYGIRGLKLLSPSNY